MQEAQIKQLKMG